MIREDDEIKGAIITALSGVVTTKEDIVRLMEHSDRRFEALINQMNKGFEDVNKRVNYTLPKGSGFVKKPSLPDKAWRNLSYDGLVTTPSVATPDRCSVVHD